MLHGFVTRCVKLSYRMNDSWYFCETVNFPMLLKNWLLSHPQPQAHRGSSGMLFYLFFYFFLLNNHCPTADQWNQNHRECVGFGSCEQSRCASQLQLEDHGTDEPGHYVYYISASQLFSCMASYRRYQPRSQWQALCTKGIWPELPIWLPKGWGSIFWRIHTQALSFTYCWTLSNYKVCEVELCCTRLFCWGLIDVP